MPSACAAGLVVMGAVLLSPSSAGADETKSKSNATSRSDDGGEPATKASGKGGGPDEAASKKDKRPIDENHRRARELFSKARDLVKQSRWAEALHAFEQSAKLRPHAVTRYDIGVCLRATGRYIEARKAFERALEEHRSKSHGRLTPRLLDETRAFLEEINRIVVAIDVRLVPANAAIAVDGRPLEVQEASHGRTLALAGTRPAGPGRKAPGGRFTILMDPGAHVITLSRKGFEDAVVNKTYAPGTKAKLDLKIAKLPATLDVDSVEPNAIVTVDGHDVGIAPVSVSRPGGRHSIVVEKDGFTPYETTASVDPGGVWRVRAELAEEPPALWDRWWFWSTLGGSVASVAVTTWFVTRPDPTRPDPSGGGLHWIVYVPAGVRW